MKNYSKKNINKNNAKLKLFFFFIICIVALGTFVYTKITAPPTLESILNNALFDTTEVTLDVSITNKNGHLNYTYTVSDENDYVKTVKTIGDTKEVSVVYKSNDTYYLYVNKGTEVTIELSNNDGSSMINDLKKEVNALNEYLDIDYDSVKYYTYSEEYVTFSSYRDYVFYDYKVVLDDNNLVSLEQTFTVDNVINTVVIDVKEMEDIVLPTIQ